MLVSFHLFFSTTQNKHQPQSQFRPVLFSACLIVKEWVKCNVSLSSIETLSYTFPELDWRITVCAEIRHRRNRVCPSCEGRYAFDRPRRCSTELLEAIRSYPVVHLVHWQRKLNFHRRSIQPNASLAEVSFEREYRNRRRAVKYARYSRQYHESRIEIVDSTGCFHLGYTVPIDRWNSVGYKPLLRSRGRLLESTSVVLSPTC